MHPACPNKEQNHLQNSLLRRTQFWVRKTFSKPASFKRASLVGQEQEEILRVIPVSPLRHGSLALLVKAGKSRDLAEAKRRRDHGSMYFEIILHHAVQKDREKKEGDIYIVNIPAPSPLPNDGDDGDDDDDTGDK